MPKQLCGVKGSKPVAPVIKTKVKTLGWVDRCLDLLINHSGRQQPVYLQRRRQSNIKLMLLPRSICHGPRQTGNLFALLTTDEDNFHRLPLPIPPPSPHQSSLLLLTQPANNGLTRPGLHFTQMTLRRLQTPLARFPQALQTFTILVSPSLMAAAGVVGTLSARHELCSLEVVTCVSIFDGIRKLSSAAMKAAPSPGRADSRQRRTVIAMSHAMLRRSNVRIMAVIGYSAEWTI